MYGNASLLGSPCMPRFGVAPPVRMGVHALWEICFGVPKIGGSAEGGREAGVLNPGKKGLVGICCNTNAVEGVVRAFGNWRLILSNWCVASHANLGSMSYKWSTTTSVQLPIASMKSGLAIVSYIRSLRCTMSRPLQDRRT